MITITAPSGRTFTYEPAGDPERIKALVALLINSLTEDGDSEQFVDKMFQAATSLFMELNTVKPNRDGDNFYVAVSAIQQGLSPWITRNAPEHGGV